MAEETPVTLDGYSYTYDRVGNRTSKTNPTDAAMNELYGYDNLSRLTSSTRGTISYGNSGAMQITSPTETQARTLDALGNMAAVTTNGTAQTRTTDAANEIQSTTTGNTTTGMTYDAAGNMTSDGTLTYTYDAWNRLVKVSNGSTILTQYQYDGSGRRVMEFTNFTGSTPGAVTYYFFDGQNAIETRTGSAGASPGSLGVQYQYVFSPLGGKVPVLRDGTFDVNGDATTAGRLYYTSDANTNVTAVVGYDTGTSTWAVQEHYVYDAYGAVTMYDGPAGTLGDWTNSHTVSSVGNTTLYASMALDPATRVYYDEARWYSTVTSTFVSRDPMGLGVANPNLQESQTIAAAGLTGNETGGLPPSAIGGQQFAAGWNQSAMAASFGQDGAGVSSGDPNLYRYVENRPTVALDPTGMDIYLKTGNNSGNPVNDAIHQYVAVDVWSDDCCKKVGIAGFSFGKVGWNWYWFKSTWLGWNSITLAGYLMTGEIYEQEGDPGTVVKTKKTTCARQGVVEVDARRARRDERRVLRRQA